MKFYIVVEVPLSVCFPCTEGSMESLMAARVQDMSTPAWLPISLNIRQKDVSPLPSVDSDSLTELRLGLAQLPYGPKQVVVRIAQ